MDHAMRKALDRIEAGASSPADEARRLGKSQRTIERRLAARKAAVGRNDVSVPVVPPGTTPVSSPTAAVPKVNAALDAALSAAGEATKGPSAVVPTSADLVAAQVDQYQFCVETIGMLKMAVGGALVQFKYTPPLSGADPDVQKLLALSQATATAIRVNVPKLYPTLTKVMAGAGVVYGIIAMEVVGMLVGLHGLAGQRGWKKAQEPEKKPDVKTYAEQLRPKPAPAELRIVPNSVPSPIHVTPPPITPDTKGATTIFNSPVPEYGG